MSLRTTLARILGRPSEGAIPATTPAPILDARTALREANQRTIDRLRDNPAGNSHALDKSSVLAELYGGMRTIEVARQVVSVPRGYSVRETGDGWFEAVSPEGALSAQCPSAQEAASLCIEHRNTALPGFAPPPKGHGPVTRAMLEESQRTIDRALFGDDIPMLFPGTKLDFGPKNFLIFINGDPRSGKDTTSALLVEAFEKRGYRAEARSSIEPVRHMLQNAGFDLSAKTEKDRFLLAEVGDRVEEHSDFRSRACIGWFRTEARIGHEKNVPVALVLHTREPATMHKIAFGLRNLSNLSIKTLFVSGRGEAVTSNKADAGVRGMVYDDEIENDGTVHELDERCDSYVDALTRSE